MLLLLNVLRNADGLDYRKLRSRPWNVRSQLVRLASFSCFLMLTEPVFLKQLPLAQTYPTPTRKHSLGYSCTPNIGHFSSVNTSTAGKLTKFPCDLIYTKNRTIRSSATTSSQHGQWCAGQWGPSSSATSQR